MSPNGSAWRTPSRRSRKHAGVQRRTPLPPELRGRAFAVREAITLGMTTGQLESKRLVRPFKGGRVPESVIDEENAILRRARAFAPLLLPGQYFSHTTAAVLLGLRLPSGFEEDVLHVTSTAGRRAPRRVGVAGHRSHCPPIAARRIPTSSPIETWLHCADVLSPTDLVIMGDGLVARQRPLATTEDLVRSIGAHVRLPGVVDLRAALARVRPRTDSAMETLLRLAITLIARVSAALLHRGARFR